MWIPKFVLPILAQLTSDLAECIDSTWALAVTGPDFNLLPVHTFGNHPDLTRCLKQIGADSIGQDLVSSRGAEGWAAKIVSPVFVHTKKIATLVFGPKRSGDDYTPRDRDLIEGTASHLAFIMKDIRLAQKIGDRFSSLQQTKMELASAREVQDRLFPYLLPPIPGLDYYGECRPVGELGGDFFDFTTTDNSSLLLTIGDVSGKGVPAAIVMAGALASLRALDASRDGKLSDVIRELNRLIWQVSPENFYATMFHARFDTSRRELQYVNAGHDGALLLRDNLKRVVKLESTGTVLGLTARASYQQRTIPLEFGDVLIAMTDGITEAADFDGRMVDEKFLLNALRNHPGASSSDMAANIIRAVDAFLSGAAPRDDRTVVVARFNGRMTEALIPEPISLRALAQVA